VTNAGKRIFVFSHYPPFLSRASEAPHYDAIDEPARSWLLSLFEEAKVEAHYAGHVHNLFFGTHCKTNHYVLPSTSFVRHDFHEFFRVAPDDEEGGRFDTDKLGFYLVDVHERGHVNHFVRTRGRCLGDGEAFDPQTLTSHGLHSWTRSVPTVGLDLRSPWCEEATIPTTFGTEIFGRKRLRNDYPVHCLWELGVRHLRLPLDDLTDHRVRTRMCELAAFGHRFSVVSFGVPSVEGIRVISANPSVVSRLEVFAPILDARSALSGLAASRSLSPTAVLFGRFRDEEGFSASQGFHVGETDLATSVLSTAESEGAHVGIVFSVAPSESPIESASIAADFAAKTGVPVTLNVPFGFDDEMSLEDRQASDLNRTLQGALAAILYPGLIVHIDNFTTLDRGYFRAIGLFDRLFNPQVGAASLKTLHRVFAEPVLSRPWTKLDGGFGVPVSWGNRHGVLVVPRDWQTGVALDWAAIGTLDDSHPELIEFANGTTTNDTARLVGGRIGRPVLLHA
jgi:hypothetical protein